MGPEEGPPVAYCWPFYLHMVRLILALAVVVLLLRRPNRVLGAWWVMLPVVLFLLPGYFDFTQINLIQYFSFLLDSVAVFVFAMACLWLLADTLEGRARMTALALALLVLLLAGCVGMVGVSALSLGLVLIPVGIVYGLLACAALGAMALAGVACARRYSPMRYLVWFFMILAVGVLCVMLLPTGVSLVVRAMIAGEALGLGDLPTLLAQYVLSAFIVALVIFMLALPYLALAIWSPVYRPRFYAVFRLPGMDSGDDKEYTGENLEIGNHE